jgi:hypothetical protein
MTTSDQTKMGVKERETKKKKKERALPVTGTKIVISVARSYFW